MNIISIDTSTSLASVALASDDKIIAESVFTCDRTLSARLVPELDRLLSMAGLGFGNIDLFTAAIGPGSFTGVRCGVATTQGLALATAKPCVGFSTLSALAMNFSLASLPVCPMLDARKSEVYGALYDCSASIPFPILPDSVMTPKHLFEAIAGVTDKMIIFSGEGALRYRDEIIDYFGGRAAFSPFTLNSSRAANGVLLALDAIKRGGAKDPAKLLPVYLRASEAEYAKLSRQQATPAC
jgi:tRNA threonylcarbamoyladenosine biosynthesis protein TsaB